ncbi:hypothetical protein K505DRAFT_415622 [Melanomma pulvis-pyrius CBS 109.77]|uniref:Uncharacterized protein n=1 Tax=Melanomma pulvis-pyrius CBS 109.77 TaxID=1314802 RepID=A0A6A6XJL7_9PLEO|nr:hypothetical protein K505DRAFT_415622 [Melanomma pulvis-pyrius CBS 109.77]
MSANVGSDTDNYDVHLGFWINWSSGKMRGSTLTMTRARGGLLIAFLALYVSSSGRSFWRIGCFFLHRLYSSSRQEDGLYHQRQAILRNADTATQSMFDLVYAIRHWRRRALRPIARILPILVFAITVFGTFTVAGLYSSNITTNTANEVLLTGKKCGILYRGTQTQEMVDIYMKTADINEQFSSQRSAAYLNYASQCYSSSHTSDSQNCRPYIKQKLSYSSTRNTTCPFQKEICLLQSENMFLDTGFLNSHYDFGINSPPQRRFSFRMTSRCAPLVTHNYSSLRQPQDGSSNNFPAMRYHYGGVNGLAPGRDDSFTYQIPVNFSPRRLDNFTSIQGSEPDYIVGSLAYTQFRPIPQLKHPDGETALLFLSAPGVTYSNTNDDPWFSAHTVFNLSKAYYGNSNKGVDVYSRDEPVGVLGCFNQYQFCNPQMDESSRCEPLNDTNSNYNEPLNTLWTSKEDQDFVKWSKNLIYASLATSPEYVFPTSGVSSLLLRAKLRSGLQSGVIPPNQWQLEMEHLFEIMLTSLQGTFVDNINGPPSPELEPAFAKPNDTSWQYICKNQKIVSTLYYSFNVLGMTIILVIGGIFILLEAVLESIVDWLDRCRRRHDAIYARLEWSANSTLQLQRMAHEELGLGTWSRCAGDLPVTEFGEKLAVLSVVDEKHPVLMNASDISLTTCSVGRGLGEKVDQHVRAEGELVDTSSVSSAFGKNACGSDVDEVHRGEYTKAAVTISDKSKSTNDDLAVTLGKVDSPMGFEQAERQL